MMEAIPYGHAQANYDKGHSTKLNTAQHGTKKFCLSQITIRNTKSKTDLETIQQFKSWRKSDLPWASHRVG